MSRTCPNCKLAIPFIRGVETRPADPAASSTWRYARRRFFCRSCGAQLRAVPTAIGYAVISLLVVAAISNLYILESALIGVPTLIAGDAICFAALAICDIRWGHRFKLASAL
jgi:hypothetical protein